MIWEYVFYDTWIEFTEWGAKRSKNPREKTLRPELALLVTCKTIYAETRDLWLGLVIVVFSDSRRMLDKLAFLPYSIQGQISQMIIPATPLRLELPIEEIQSTIRSPKSFDFPVWQALSLMKRLKLDVLMIDCRNQYDEKRPPKELYQELDGLIQYSDGWKQLYFVTTESTMLGYGSQASSQRRNLQPQNWDQSLNKRDDENCRYRSSVKIHRAISANKPGAAFVGKIFEQTKSATGFTTMDKDPFLNSRGERSKELLLTALRGTEAEAKDEFNPTAFDDEAKACAEIILDTHIQTVTWGDLKRAEKRWNMIKKVRGHGRDLTVQDVRKAVDKMWEHFVDCHEIVSSGVRPTRGQNIMDGILKSHKSLIQSLASGWNAK